METRTLPDGYLDVCSIEALESLELARLSKAANLRGEMKEVLRRWIDAEVDAKLARWMLEKRRSQQFRAGGAAKPSPAQSVLGPPTGASGGARLVQRGPSSPNESTVRPNCAPGLVMNPQPGGTFSAAPSNVAASRELADLLPAEPAIAEVAVVPLVSALQRRPKPQDRRTPKILPTRALRVRSPARMLRKVSAVRRRA